MISRFRAAAAIAAAACTFFAGTAPARAALDMVVAPQSAVANKPFSDCSARAKNALTAVMQSAVEAGTGSGNWVGIHRIDGSVSASAVVECHPVDTGYVASFTCAVQVPPNADTANALCTKIGTAFNAATAGYAGGATWHR